MEKWYIRLHEWLMFYGFHVGKYTIVPWILWVWYTVDGSEIRRVLKPPGLDVFETLVNNGR